MSQAAKDAVIAYVKERVDGYNAMVEHEDFSRIRNGRVRLSGDSTSL